MELAGTMLRQTVGVVFSAYVRVHSFMTGVWAYSMALLYLIALLFKSCLLLISVIYAGGLIMPLPVSTDASRHSTDQALCTIITVNALLCLLVTLRECLVVLLRTFSPRYHLTEQLRRLVGRPSMAIGRLGGGSTRGNAKGEKREVSTATDDAAEVGEDTKEGEEQEELYGQPVAPIVESTVGKAAIHPLVVPVWRAIVAVQSGVYAVYTAVTLLYQEHSSLAACCGVVLLLALSYEVDHHPPTTTTTTTTTAEPVLASVLPGDDLLSRRFASSTVLLQQAMALIGQAFSELAWAVVQTHFTWLLTLFGTSLSTESSPDCPWPTLGTIDPVFYLAVSLAFVALTSSMLQVLYGKVIHHQHA